MLINRVPALKKANFLINIDAKILKKMLANENQHNIKKSMHHKQETFTLGLQVWTEKERNQGKTR